MLSSASSSSLKGYICIVTGATRGIGKGIALQLGGAGATVYITGRTTEPTGSGVGGSLRETAEEIENRGGNAITVVCDHNDPEQIESLFSKVNREQKGQLDLLVNNAYSAVPLLMETMGKKFWETEPTEMWDTVNSVGLRNHYICSCHAARMMVPRKSGLIVNISSAGGLSYLFNVAYGVGKAGVDRMAADMAHELKGTGVTVVSLWPGSVRTEVVTDAMKTRSDDFSLARIFSEESESVEYSGTAIVCLMRDSKLSQKSGRVLISAELGKEYGFSDIDGKTKKSVRSVQYLMKVFGWNRSAAWVPAWIKLPYFMLTMQGQKF